MPPISPVNRLTNLIKTDIVAPLDNLKRKGKPHDGLLWPHLGWNSWILQIHLGGNSTAIPVPERKGENRADRGSFPGDDLGQSLGHKAYHFTAKAIQHRQPAHSQCN